MIGRFGRRRRDPARGRRRTELVQLSTGRQARVALIGNPNTGKTSLFNALTGLRQKVANVPGVTVDLGRGRFPTPRRWIDLVDLPGLYALAPHSPDEEIALDFLTGAGGEPPPDAVIAVVDATQLERSLYLVTQLQELGLPLLVALNLFDAAGAEGKVIDAERLSRQLGAAVVVTSALTGFGLDLLPHELDRVLDDVVPEQPGDRPGPIPPLRQAARRWATAHPAAFRDAGPFRELLVERSLIDVGGALERRLVDALGVPTRGDLAEVRHDLLRSLAPRKSLTELEAEARYARVREALAGVVERDEATAYSPAARRRLRADHLLSHPVLGSLLFFLTMAVVFQSVFSWATPLMDAIDAATGWCADLVRANLPEGVLASLLADGVIAGVGAVVIFLPQILILFTFLLLLEDSGYMARAAFLVDRLMRLCGLSGQSFLPMLSSFACAIPGIMATRVIPNRRDRLATIMAAPFMTCSARLPVYAFLIAAFVPRRSWGPVNLQGLVLFALYLLGILGGIATALLLKRSLLRGPTPTFLLELPPYRRPDLRSLALRVMQRGRLFLTRAGTVIFAVTVVVWALAYFPRDAASKLAVEASAAPVPGVSAEAEPPSSRDAEAAQLAGSYLGQMGRAVEPLFEPLGWDWRVSSAVIASFPAREVLLAALGTIYALGSEVDEQDAGLIDRVRTARWPDGRLIFTLPVALGLMVFFAFCLQCGATMATMRRETGSWRWPILAWLYMTGLGYLGAWLVVRIGSTVG
ncbi:MAG: ferrous iron transport protein B [Acidobacteria bacterium]|nr:MAG: ferrous iron transport protein B [Acidobacteriota bacterium]REK08858.1 MAG: ferrous iron transport protein B [Acidobacteriota bacterium]